MKPWRPNWASALPRTAVLAHDLIMVWLSWNGLRLVRHGLLAGTPIDVPPLTSPEMLLVLIAQGLVLWRVGLYRGLWRFASVPDLFNLAKAAVLGVIAITLGLFLYNRLATVPRTVLLLYPFALVGLLGAPRLLYRVWKEHALARNHAHGVRVLILGAGLAGEALVRDMRRTGAYSPVGFLDDAAQLRGSKVQGVPVLGPIAELETIARETAARLIVIAMPSVHATLLQRVVAVCERTGIPFRMVPRLDDMLEGRSQPGELKEVAIEDLLGRSPVMPDWKAIRGWLGGRSVLVTGGGGSIGAELCRQCAKHGARRVGIVEIDELALTTTVAELKRDFPDLECVPLLGDCGDPAVIAHALRLSEPDSVFHAAAYKQVPLLEEQLREAVRNNVLATDTVAHACHDNGVGTFVLISTDKAVDPVNVLGATKRLAEIACQSLVDRRSTRFVTVRFGNVLDSAGSVVPLFREQIRKGGPVTVTDPEVTRFFMTIPEACQLILQASAIGSHEAVYTLDMGEPVAIRVLAEQMIRLAGKQPGRDIAIVYSGLRAGEKLHETLFHADERYRPTSHPKILQAEPRAVSPDAVHEALAQLREACGRYDLEIMSKVLRASVPEFAPAPAVHATAATVVAFPARNARRI